METEAVKRCSVCREEKPLSDFYRHNKSPDGHGYACKSCSVARARQWAKEHPDRHRENMRRHGQTARYKQTRRALRERKRDALFAQRKDWYARNREEINARQRARYASDPEFRARSNARQRQYIQGNRRKRGQWQRQALYGLSPEKYDEMLLAQEGRCAICAEPADLVVDHDHSEAERPLVRGLLCERCNHGLGHFRDNADHLGAAADYLRRLDNIGAGIA